MAGRDVITDGTNLVRRFPNVPATVSLHTVIGGRKSQEDRFSICPHLIDGETNCCFYGVFDGTVGDFASDTVKDLVVPYLREDLKSKLLPQTPEEEKESAESSLPRSSNFTNPAMESRQVAMTSDQKMSALRKAMKTMYHKTDEELLRRCGVEGKHYAASTSVTLCLWQDLICVGHLGDSRICLIYITESNLSLFKATDNTTALEAAGYGDENEEPVREEADLSVGKKNMAYTYQPKTLDKDWIAPGAIRVDEIPLDKVETVVEGNFVTNDHKPDHSEERSRIEQSGGSVEYLHNHQNKPFIRGGDFQQRKLLGESPMQLQYSRAFGGKDLKPFGLIADPTVNVTKREKQFVGFILASDGLWDILSADVAARTATKAFLRKENPSEALVNKALHTSCDNITAICVFYDTVGGDR